MTTGGATEPTSLDDRRRRLARWTGLTEAQVAEKVDAVVARSGPLGAQTRATLLAIFAGTGEPAVEHRKTA